MRSNHTILATLLLVALPAQAQQATTTTPAPAEAPAKPLGPLTARPSYQARIDANAIHTNQGGSTNDTVQFTDWIIRMAIAGDIGPGVTYLLRYDVRNQFLSDPAYNGTDGVIGSLERAYIQQDVTPWLSLRYGRQPMTALSAEGDYSSLDLYEVSKIYEQVFWYNMGSADGIGSTFTFGKQTFVAQVFDGPQDQGGSQTVNGTHNENLGTQKGENMTYALGWRGRLFHDHVKPLVSYDWYNRVRNGHGNTLDGRQEWTTSGVGAVFSAFNTDLEAEWDTMHKPAFTSHVWDASDQATAVDNPKEVWNTYVATLAYNVPHPNLRFFVKGSTDHQRVGSADVFYKRGSAGVEYRPFNGPFRYHFVVINQDDQQLPGAKNPAAKRTVQYTVGVAARG